MKQPVEIMVVDDEAIVCERLQDYLQKQGMSVEAFTESQKALDRLKEKSFDVIVTDLKMEGPTGMDILSTVKRLEYGSEVILITAYGQYEVMREAKAVGVFEYIDKPFKMSDMHKLVKKAAERSRKRSK
ncbi:MAG: response regulator [Candidatus Latescibacterota bacterium]|jgi:DNA-binding NtrC family response regulator